MDRATTMRRLIERAKGDFVSYFEGTPHEDDADRIIAAAVVGSVTLSDDRALLEAILPNTEDDGRWEASYALNTGAMMLNLIDYVSTRDEQHYRDAVTLFFDTVDFKIHEDLEQAGIATPTDEQLASHPLLIREKRWFASLESAPSASVAPVPAVGAEHAQARRRPLRKTFDQIKVDSNSWSPLHAETEIPSNEDGSVFISSVWLKPPQPRFTIFHALWLAGVIGAGVLGLRVALQRDFSLFARGAVVIAAAAGGLLVFHVLTFLLVTVLVIPRLGRFTYWAYEVECYMLFILGDTWRNAREVEGFRRNTSAKDEQVKR